MINRREFLMAPAAVSAAAAQARKQPNILHLQSDQRQWATIRRTLPLPYAQPESPGLRRDAVRASYTPSAVCCPSRAMTLSGAYHRQARLARPGGPAVAPGSDRGSRRRRRADGALGPRSQGRHPTTPRAGRRAEAGRPEITVCDAFPPTQVDTFRERCAGRGVRVPSATPCRAGPSIPRPENPRGSVAGASRCPQARVRRSPPSRHPSWRR